MKGDGRMGKMNTMETVTLILPEELVQGIRAMAKLKQLSEEMLIRLWVEEGLEKEELRFERLLLFADLAEELDDASLELLSHLKARYFDERSDGQRGLDSYMVKGRNLNQLYIASSGKIPGYTAK